MVTVPTAQQHWDCAQPSSAVYVPAHGSSHAAVLHDTLLAGRDEAHWSAGITRLWASSHVYSTDCTPPPQGAEQVPVDVFIQEPLHAWVLHDTVDCGKVVGEHWLSLTTAPLWSAHS